MRRHLTKSLAVLTILIWGGASWVLAGHDDDFRPRALERLAVDAQRLQVATRHLERDASRVAFYGRFRAVEAIHEIRQLRRETRRFQRELDGFTNPRRLERRYRNLVFAFQDVEWTVGRMHNGHVRHQLRNVDRALRKLSRDFRFVVGRDVRDTRRAYRVADWDDRDDDRRDDRREGRRGRR